MHFLRIATTASCHSLSSVVSGWITAGNGRHAKGWHDSWGFLDVSSFNVEISVLFHFPSSANEWNMKLKLIAPPSRENWFLWDKHTLMKEAAAPQTRDCYQLLGRSATKLPFEMINQQKLHLMRRQKQRQALEKARWLWVRKKWISRENFSSARSTMKIEKAWKRFREK